LRVLVVGAGVVGLASALYASRRGHDVTVLDAGDGDGGCSFGNSGMIVPSHFTPLAAPGMVSMGLRYMGDPESPFYVRPRLSWDLLTWGFRFWRAARRSRVDRAAPVLRDLHLASRALYEEWAGALGDFGLEKGGLLMLCNTEPGLAEETHAAREAQALGVPAEVLTGDGVRALEPSLTVEVRGGVYYPLDCFLDPGRLMSALRSELGRRGVAIRLRTRVAGFDREGSRIRGARTDGGVVEADEFVLAAGIWSDAVARDLGLRLPMQAGKGYSLTLPDPPERPRHCAILVEGRVAVTPMGSGVRFGGTMELCGVDLGIDAARVRGIKRSVRAYLPRFQEASFEGIAPWCGLRPCSPDGLPYLGRFRKYGNLSAATGHAMMGVSLGPISGRLIGEILAGERPSLDLSVLSPDRYS
jgi:D-amino-acid dehydrogenase